MRKRLLYACYVIISLLAIILFFGGIYVKDELCKSFLLNISAGCVGTVLFFYNFQDFSC